VHEQQRRAAAGDIGAQAAGGAVELEAFAADGGGKRNRHEPSIAQVKSGTGKACLTGADSDGRIASRPPAIDRDDAVLSATMLGGLRPREHMLPP
jgi:hypothetical protein